MFAGPALILFCMVIIIPFLYGLYLTFTSWDGVSAEKPLVGFANYVSAFKDAYFWASMGRTIFYSAFAVVFVNAVAFALAYLVTSGIKGQNFFRAGLSGNKRHQGTEFLPRRVLHSEPDRRHRIRLCMEVRLQPRFCCYRCSIH